MRSLAKVVRRILSSAKLRKELRKALDGENVLIRIETSFADKKPAAVTVMPIKEKNRRK